MTGYLLAYEGVLDDLNAEQSALGKAFFDKPVIYLADLASDRKSQLAGGKLIHGFTELYKQNYLEKGIYIPLFMQAREQTSYRILKRQLEAVSKALGIEFNMVELPSYSEGNDSMHPVILVPMKR